MLDAMSNGFRLQPVYAPPRSIPKTPSLQSRYLGFNLCSRWQEWLFRAILLTSFVLAILQTQLNQ